MIQAKRVLDVMTFLKPGEQWEVMDYGHSLRITVFGAENDISKLEMSHLVSSEKGRYLRHAFLRYNLLTQENPVESMAFELVSMASELGVYK